MPAGLLWRRIVRCGKKLREEADADHKKWVIELLSHARCATYALRANADLPPTREEAKKKKPNWAKVEKARDQMLKFMQAHDKGLSHPYHFESYMGLPHAFDAPPPETVKTSKQYREEEKQQVSAMEGRLVGILDRMIEKHGDAPIDQALAGSA